MSKLRDILAAVAPTVATALGGPLAGVATRAIASKMLGREDATEDEVQEAVTSANGADLLKLKELELEFAKYLKDADIKLEQIASDDRSSARDRQARMKDWTPTILGLAIIVGFFGALAYIFVYGLPDSGSEVLLLMIGSLGAMTTQVANYYFGSSAGSKSKNAIISNLREATT